MPARPPLRMPWGLVAWWCVLLTLHCVCLAYYVGVALAYKNLPKVNLTFQFRTYSIGIAETEYYKIAQAHIVVAAAHSFFILLMLVGSIQQRMLVYYPDLRPLWRFLAAKLHVKSPRSRRASSKSPSSSRRRSSFLDSARFNSLVSLTDQATASASRISSAVFGRTGLLGVESKYFDHLLLARELVETGLQTYQAYRMTQVLPRLWLIRFYVVLLVANCWIVPVLHRVYINAHQKRRLLSLVCDAALDLVSSIGISLLIFFTYLPQYNDDRFGFPFDNWYNDKWFVSVLQEFQMMVVVSWGDMASRLVFAFGVLQSFESLKEMLEPELRQYTDAAASRTRIPSALPPHSKTVKRSPTVTSVPARLACTTTDVQVDGMQLDPTPALVDPTPMLVLTDPITLDKGAPSVRPDPVAPGPSALVKPDPAKKTNAAMARIHSVVHFTLHVVAPCLFVLWGFGILGVHIYAESRRIDSPCQLPLRPWLSREPACSLVEIDCDRLGVSGTTDTLGNAWTVFDPLLTAGLVVRHCPQLEVPPSMALFTGLTSMKTYNSTIVRWESDAGFTTSSHARLRALYLVRTNLPQAALPPGLLRKDFPQTFRSFFMSKTNVQTLPSDLHLLWPKRMGLAIEYGGLTAFPSVVLRMLPGMLSFAQNPITSVPAGLFELPSLRNLMLSYTNLQALPENVNKLRVRVYILMLEGTTISTFWSWMDPMIATSLSYRLRFFNAHNTPFCQERAQILNGTRAQFSEWSASNASRYATVMDVSTPSRRAYATEAVACGPDFQSMMSLPIQDQLYRLQTS